MKGGAGRTKNQAKGEEDARNQAAAADQAKIDRFAKAHSACLEGKGCSVKKSLTEPGTPLDDKKGPQEFWVLHDKGKMR